MVCAISVDGLRKRFDNAEVLRGIDCEIGAGESFGLVGANGVGKTTLLKSILDYVATDAGEIRIFGVSSRQSQARSRLAFLPEQFVPPYFLRGRDFLTYIARLHGVSLDDGRLAQVFDIVQLGSGAMERSVREFSKGMAQKLGLAATFLSGKELLIMDEPLSGLDPAARASIKRHLTRLRDGGTTLLFTTHLLSDVEALCDRIGILNDGVLGYVGTPQACKAQYGCASLEDAYLECVGAR
jgi:ABC-2 type transport system ATP-binding protein